MMTSIYLLIVIITLLHVYFLILEMFLWDKPTGLRTFRMTAEKAAITKTLAANQGLYNGFLAAGLIWGLISTDSDFSICIFFLSCVTIAGIYGAITVSKKILFIQALPAAIALAMIYIQLHTSH
jgi:putative membrane protein